MSRGNKALYFFFGRPLTTDLWLPGLGKCWSRISKPLLNGSKLFIVFGSYHWWKKITAFRHDYCRNCEEDITAHLIRTFDVVHIYWIPVFPYGMWGRWRCEECGIHPHVNNIRTRKSFKILGVIVLSFLALIMWAPQPTQDADMEIIWGMRIGLPVALIALAVSLYRHGDPPAFKEKLAQVERYTSSSCILCDGELAGGHPECCDECGARHLPLRKSDYN